jgi:hypothetical protein
MIGLETIRLFLNCGLFHIFYHFIQVLAFCPLLNNIIFFQNSHGFQTLSVDYLHTAKMFSSSCIQSVDYMDVLNAILRHFLFFMMVSKSVTVILF